MNTDTNRLNQLTLEIVGMVDNINESKDFLDAVENPQGTIRLSIDCLWIKEAYRTHYFNFDLTKMPNVYKVLIDALKEDMAYQEEQLKQCGVELSK